MEWITIFCVAVRVVILPLLVCRLRVEVGILVIIQILGVPLDCL